MEIDNLQQQQLQNAILGAFPTRKDLEIMVKRGLDENLSAIVAEGNLNHMVFELIQWSITREKLQELVAGALEQNSQNHQLVSIAKQLGLSYTTADQQSRLHMLNRLNRAYRGLIQQSLQKVALLGLEFTENPDKVENIITRLTPLSNQTKQSYPPGTPILEVYDKAAQKLLILGDPGAGKSLLLLDLAQRLVKRALTDETHPLPIIFPLSSWVVQHLPLEDWIVKQLTQLYDILQHLSSTLYNSNALTDGTR